MQRSSRVEIAGVILTVCALAVMILGIALVSVPAALIIGGLLGVFAGTALVARAQKIGQTE